MSTLSKLTNLLKSNPDVLNTYVSLGFALVDKTVSPLNKLMHHLLEVQGIDPSTQPGAQARKELTDLIDHVNDSEEYDEDFDFSRFHTKYKKVRDSLKSLNLSKEQYKKMTDLSKVDDHAPALYRTKPAPTRTLPHLPGVEVEDECLNTKEGRAAYRTKVVEAAKEYLKSEMDPMQELAMFMEPVKPHVDDKPTSFDPLSELGAFGNKYNAGSLKDALKALANLADKVGANHSSFEKVVENTLGKDKALKLLNEYADRYRSNSEESEAKVSAARQPSVVGGTRVTKGRFKTTKTFKNGLFRRVEDK